MTGVKSSVLCFELYYLEIYIIQFDILYIKGFNFGEFEARGLHEKRAVETRNLGTVSAFVWTQKKSKKPLCQDGRSQDLPDTY